MVKPQCGKLCKVKVSLSSNSGPWHLAAKLLIPTQNMYMKVYSYFSQKGSNQDTLQ